MATGILIAILAGFYVHIRHFDFVQDDSFITFRYIRNLIEGNGLVFNPGERVEGYTTFLWTVLLALPAAAGFDLIASSQNIGLVFGIAAGVVLYRLAGEVAPGPRHRAFSLLAPLLLAANTSMAYWTVSGMETPLFTFLTVLAVWLTIRERGSGERFPLAPVAFVLLALTRPEGMFLFGLTFLAKAWWAVRTDRDRRPRELKRLAVWTAVFAVPIAGFMAWRLSYYGYLFPNTYYAKAGLSREYLSAGIDYLTAFAKSYLVWGALLAFPVISLIRRERKAELALCAFLVAAYTAYVVLVGGDVLPAHRFFIPILPLIYLLVSEGLADLYASWEARRSGLKHLVLAGSLLIAYLTATNAYDYVRDYWTKENGLVGHMTDVGAWLKSHTPPGGAVAASTIGAISYYSGVPLIDMLGLTDETIAHHPETIFGVKSGWKERNYNVTYVLSRKPDWIMFSTNIKPSAFAERALFTKEEFRRWYYPYYFHAAGDANDVSVIYMRAPVPLPERAPDSARKVDFDFINRFYDGMNLSRRWPKESMEQYRKSLAIAPSDFALLYQEIAGLYQRDKKNAEAQTYYQRAIEADPRMIDSRIMLGLYARDRQDYESASSHFKKLTEVDPDYTVGWTLLAGSRLSLRDTAGAREACLKALEVTPNNGEAYSVLQRLPGRQ